MARRRIAILVIACLLLTGCASADDGEPTPASGDTGGSLLPMTLTGWLFTPGDDPATADPVAVAHASLQPLEPGENDLTIAITDLTGLPLDTGDALDVTVRALVPDAEASTISTEPIDGEPATWAAEELDLPDEGWYELDLALGDRATGELWLLLPDPSVHSGAAVELAESDVDAEALYRRALYAYSAWDAGAWRESLASGADVLVVTEYAVTDRECAPVAMSAHSRYAGSFREQPDGSDAEPPREGFAHRIVIGDQGWTRDGTGGWTRQQALVSAGFEERADIYTGATNVLPGGTAEIDGVEAEIVTFYLPPKGGQAEAWFAWWIDPNTGDPLRMVMVAEMHFMVWDFVDIDGDFEITPPADASATPAAHAGS